MSIAILLSLLKPSFSFSPLCSLHDAAECKTLYIHLKEAETCNTVFTSFIVFVSTRRSGVGDGRHHSDGSPSWSSHSGPAGHRDPGSPRLRGRSPFLLSVSKYMNTFLFSNETNYDGFRVPWSRGIVFTHQSDSDFMNKTLSLN